MLADCGQSREYLRLRLKSMRKGKWKEKQECEE